MAQTPVQGRIEFLDPLAPATPQTPMISLVHKNASMITQDKGNNSSERHTTKKPIHDGEDLPPILDKQNAVEQG